MQKTYGIEGEAKVGYLKETSDRKSEHTVETAFFTHFLELCSLLRYWSNIRKVDIFGLWRGEVGRGGWGHGPAPSG